MFGLSFILDSSITGGHKQAQYPPSAPEYRPGRHPGDRSEGGGGIKSCVGDYPQSPPTPPRFRSRSSGCWRIQECV